MTDAVNQLRQICNNLGEESFDELLVKGTLETLLATLDSDFETKKEWIELGLAFAKKQVEKRNG